MSDRDSLTNATIADDLERFAGLLEIAGESSFRIRAYQRAAEGIRFYSQPIADVAAHGQLLEIPGIGAGIAALLTDMVKSGILQPLTDLEQSLPLSLLELRDLPGVGPKTVARLHSELGISTLTDLEAALNTGKLRGIAGMGAKAETRLRDSLRARLHQSGRFRLGTAMPMARRFINRVRDLLPPTSQISLAGSLRRWEETVGNINLVIATDNSARDLALIERLSDVFSSTLVASDHHLLQLQSGIPVELRTVAPARFGTVLVEQTGSRDHVTQLGSLPDAASEETLYRALGLEWIPPELRQGKDEIALARAGTLPRLVTVADIRGEFHCHTTWSDGTGTLEEMTASAIAHGYQFLGISDHSGALGVARGLNRDRLREQRLAIEAIRPLRPKLRIYASS